MPHKDYETVLPRRGTKLTGAKGEITVNEQGTQAFVHDGVTPGGIALGPGGLGQSKWTSSSGTYNGLVATRAKTHNTSFTNIFQTMSRSIHVARSNITSIGCAFAQWFVNAGVESGAGGPAIITASIEYPLGQKVTQLTFNGGQLQGQVDDWTTIHSDLVTCQIPAGSLFAVREYRNMPSGGFCPASNDNGIHQNVAAGDCLAIFSPDLTGVPGAFASYDTNYFMRPVAIFGPTSDPGYALLGDSRTEGFEDDPTVSLDNGELARTVGMTRGYMNLARSAERLAATQSDVGFRLRQALVSQYATHVISAYGVNDIMADGTSAASTLALLDKLRSMFRDKWFYQTTLMGETSSSDAWASVGGQTTLNANNEKQRELFNNFLRSGIVRLDGVFDNALFFESARNSGLWKAPNYTGDGIHPSPAGYAALAQAGVIQVA